MYDVYFDKNTPHEMFFYFRTDEYNLKAIVAMYKQIYHPSLNLWVTVKNPEGEIIFDGLY